MTSSQRIISRTVADGKRFGFINHTALRMEKKMGMEVSERGVVLRLKMEAD